MQFIKQFTEISKNDVAMAGGKGASLGEMVQAGMPIPPGFVVLAGAFDRFLAETDISVEVAAIFDTVNIAEMQTVEHASEKIQALILQAVMPDDIQSEILNAYTHLCHCEESATKQSTISTLHKTDRHVARPPRDDRNFFVAVRSSATAEDGAAAAWAGQLDSFLNTTEENLLANIKKCWASLFTPRAIFYGFDKGFYKPSTPTNSPLEEGENQTTPIPLLSKERLGEVKSHPISVAVVVQQMVQSEVSGVAFSVHPVTENRNQLIIEAGYGLGEAVVSGQVAPDSYVVAKSPLEIIDKNVSIQDRMLVRSGLGGNEWALINRRPTDIVDSKDKPSVVPVSTSLRGKTGTHLNTQNAGSPGLEDSPEDDRIESNQKLSDTQILELSQLVINIENHYNFPCDIEWAFAGNKFYITQNRPITTLKYN